MKRLILSAVVGAVMLLGIGAAPSASAEHAGNHGQQTLGAVGLVNAVVGLQTGNINVLNSSFHNVHVIENILNNNDIDVTVIDGDVTVQDILNICQNNPGNCLVSGNTVTIDNVTVVISDIVAIVQLLGGGVLVVF